MSDAAKTTAFRWVEEMQPEWSAWNSHIWHLAETAWREYRSAEWYVKRLRAEGFSVEDGSGGMPTAFSATWSNGPGPAIMAYAEYDAVPGNCQVAGTYRAPRQGLAPPIDFPWPEYVETPRGRRWWIPATAVDRAMERK